MESTFQEMAELWLGNIRCRKPVLWSRGTCKTISGNIRRPAGSGR